MQHEKVKHSNVACVRERLVASLSIFSKYVLPRFLESPTQPWIACRVLTTPSQDVMDMRWRFLGRNAPDVADFKRWKEFELGLAAGTILQLQRKRPKIDNRVISEEELRQQLQEHKALMGLNLPELFTTQESASRSLRSSPDVRHTSFQERREYLLLCISQPSLRCHLHQQYPPPFPPGTPSRYAYFH